MSVLAELAALVEFVEIWNVVVDRACTDADGDKGRALDDVGGGHVTGGGGLRGFRFLWPRLHCSQVRALRHLLSTSWAPSRSSSAGGFVGTHSVARRVASSTSSSSSVPRGLRAGLCFGVDAGRAGELTFGRCRDDPLGAVRGFVHLVH